MAPDTRVSDFMQRIYSRATEQERAAVRPLATVGDSTPLAPAVPAWYELRPLPERAKKPFLPRLMQYVGNYNSKGYTLPGKVANRAV